MNGPTTSGPNPTRTRNLIWNPNHARKKPKVKLGLKTFAILPSYFDYIFAHLKQKERLRPELSPKFLSTLGPNPARNRPEKPGPTYNSEFDNQTILPTCVNRCIVNQCCYNDFRTVEFLQSIVDMLSHNFTSRASQWNVLWLKYSPGYIPGPYVMVRWCWEPVIFLKCCFQCHLPLLYSSNFCHLSCFQHRHRLSEFFLLVVVLH